jgi:preprotein translocase subunit SecA
LADLLVESHAALRRKGPLGEPMMRWLERRIILDIVDTRWKDHLLTLDHLKGGIGLRGYDQKDPLVEFKKSFYPV